MKKAFFLSLLLFTFFTAGAQRKLIDSLRAKLNRNLDDTTRVNTLLEISHDYYLSNPDSNIIFAQQAYELAEKFKLAQKRSRALNNMATGYATLGDYAKATQMFYKSLRISESLHDVPNIVRVYNNLGDTYTRQGDYRKALNNLLPANKQLNEYLANHRLTRPNDIRLAPVLLLNIGEGFLNLGKIDSADYYVQQSNKQSKHFDDLLNNIDRDLGEIEIARGHKDKALKYLRDAVHLSIAIDDQQMLSESYLSAAKLYHNVKQQDSAEFYAQKAFDVARAGKFEQDVLNAGKVLYAYYDEDSNLPVAYKYFKLAMAAKDSLYSQEKVKQLLSLDFEEKQRQQEIEAARAEAENKVRIYVLSGVIAVFLLLAAIFWRNSNQRKKANRLLSKQKKEIEEQRDQTNKALTELQQTQTQLIQREKMASLGELTAGIAHEIQNPLNFVNNFSEVNKEMLLELETEIKNGNTEDALALTTDIIQNEEKINHHGKRADAIVKGMLQHSQSGSGTKELTNINALADEYLRLSYHGLRSKDKRFNAEMVTHFDEKLPQINVIPQDIGRVMLNLFNNAFYAVNKKQKTAGEGYRAEVSVTTTKENGHAIIKVKDNGAGIPDTIKDKIMQPFFTTKPTGEGTGLGLSLTYDIVVKGHGGSIQVDSLEGEGSEFTIQLPIKTDR
jgi:two-component system NtrC family sensor kinase